MHSPCDLLLPTQSNLETTVCARHERDLIVSAYELIDCPRRAFLLPGTLIQGNHTDASAGGFARICRETCIKKAVAFKSLWIRQGDAKLRKARHEDTFVARDDDGPLPKLLSAVSIDPRRPFRDDSRIASSCVPIRLESRGEHGPGETWGRHCESLARAARGSIEARPRVSDTAYFALAVLFPACHSIPARAHRAPPEMGGAFVERRAAGQAPPLRNRGSAHVTMDE